MRTRTVNLFGWTGLAVSALGLAPLAKKAALNGGAMPFPVALSTVTITAMFVLAWLVYQGRARLLCNTEGRQRTAILVVGALGSGLVPLLGVLSMTETSASNRALFQSAYPAATALAARMLLGERLPLPIYGFIALICFGLALVNVDPQSGPMRLGWPFWALLATLPAIGLSDVIAKRALVDLSPEVVAAGRALGGTAVLLLTLPWITGNAWFNLLAVWPWVLFAGACMAVFAIALYQVFQRTRAAIAASLIALAPLLTLVTEAGLFGMPLRSFQVVGFALALLAVVMVSRRA